MIDWTAIVEGGLGALGAAGLALAFYVRGTTDARIASAIDASVKDGKIATSIDAKVERIGSALYDRINDHDQRLTRAEAKVDDLPRSADLHRISLQVAEAIGELKGVRAEMNGVRDNSRSNQMALARLEQWALESASKGTK